MIETTGRLISSTNGASALTLGIDATLKLSALLHGIPSHAIPLIISPFEVYPNDQLATLISTWHQKFIGSSRNCSSNYGVFTKIAFIYLPPKIQTDQPEVLEKLAPIVEALAKPPNFAFIQDWLTEVLDNEVVNLLDLLEIIKKHFSPTCQAHLLKSIKNLHPDQRLDVLNRTNALLGDIAEHQYVSKINLFTAIANIPPIQRETLISRCTPLFQKLQNKSDKHILLSEFHYHPTEAHFRLLDHLSSLLSFSTITSSLQEFLPLGIEDRVVQVLDSLPKPLSNDPASFFRNLFSKDASLLEEAYKFISNPLKSANVNQSNQRAQLAWQQIQCYIPSEKSNQAAPTGLSLVKFTLK